MKHTLPQLPYAYDALEPFIDARTMEIHHAKHHKAYVDKLNATLEKYPDLREKSVEELLKNLSHVPEDIRGAVRNHGGGHYNHSLFWNWLAPPAKGGGGAPTGELLKKIQGRVRKCRIKSLRKRLGVAHRGFFGAAESRFNRESGQSYFRRAYSAFGN